MKLPLLAAMVTFSQLASATLPTALVWAKDQDRGQEQDRGRDQGRGREQQPGRSREQRQAPPQREQIQPRIERQSRPQELRQAGPQEQRQYRPQEQRQAGPQEQRQYRPQEQRQAGPQEQRQYRPQEQRQYRPQEQRQYHDQNRPYVQEPSRHYQDPHYWDRSRPQAQQYGHYWGPALPFRHRPDYYVPYGRTRYYRDRLIIRPYGHWYPGYGYYYHDSDAFAFLAFTAITLAILDIMSLSQQRALENAQIRATTAPIGAPIYWYEGNAYGSVTAMRDGEDSDGRYCREFQQQVTIGSRRETAYGTACRQYDGTWEIVETR